MENRAAANALYQTQGIVVKRKANDEKYVHFHTKSVILRHENDIDEGVHKVSFSDLKDVLNAFAAAAPEIAMGYYKDSTFSLISTVAFLIGVPQRIFENENEPPELSAYRKLNEDKNARIIRNLCMLRTAVERNFGRINGIMNSEFRGLASIPEYVPVECIDQLAHDGIPTKTNQKLGQYIIDFNRHISNRINNCKGLFPIWITWTYIKDLFVMPDGLTETGIKAEAEKYYANLSLYPYQMYVNWLPSDEGNILFNDKKFAKLLYQWNDDEFTDFSKVSDASFLTKHNIYDFIEMSEKTVFVVDCENSDPYRLCATLRNLDAQYLKKITKIILYDDVNTATAWGILDTFTGIPIEHILIERLKLSKSLVDIKLTAGTCKEYYQNSVDSFVIVSSDSDYWGLISSIPEANFLVMVEHEKMGADMKNALFNSGIFYCFIDDFYSGNANEIKVNALLREVRRYLDQSVRLNVNQMMEAAYRATRIEMSAPERQQFFDKHIKGLYVSIDEGGNLTIQLRNR